MTLATTELVLGLMFSAVWLLIALVVAMPAKQSESSASYELSRDPGRADRRHSRPELIVPRRRRARVSARWVPRPLRD